jgi:AcrR family transcriptional regulator
MSLSLEQGSGDAVETALLDAAYVQVQLVGFRRTTFADVATRVGVSRMTAYRRFPDISSVIRALMTREFSAIVDRAARDAAKLENERERIVASAVRGLDLLCSHELFLRLLDVDPELLLPYITQRPGRFQEIVATSLVTRLETAIAGGSVRDDDPERLAHAMLLAMRGYAFSIRDGTPRAERQRLLDDLARMLDGLLLPAGGTPARSRFI